MIDEIKNKVKFPFSNIDETNDYSRTLKNKKNG
jgi:hypothetical protein